jgi:hypothetical protein
MVSVVKSGRKRIEFFVSYAHKNQQLAESFVDELMDVLSPSKAYEYVTWMDSAILVGDQWQKQILDARDRCTFGLLLVSPAFLSSGFIGENELPRYVGEGKAASIPVMLSKVDFQLHDLKGLEELQIFRYMGRRYSEPRAYGECKSGSPRRDFVYSLFQAIEKKLSLLDL